MRKVQINKGYSLPETLSDKRIYTDKYILGLKGETINGDGLNVCLPSLPTDINIFAELPNDIYKNQDVKSFFSVLRNTLVKTNLEGVTLSKLCISEQSESGVVLDWIYNYFRVYFSFDSKEGNYFGIISRNPEEGSYFNDFRALIAEKYEAIAKYIVDYVVMLIRA